MMLARPEDRRGMNGRDAPRRGPVEVVGLTGERGRPVERLASRLTDPERRSVDRLPGGRAEKHPPARAYDVQLGEQPRLAGRHVSPGGSLVDPLLAPSAREAEVLDGVR